jgi:ribonuclease G
MAKNLLVINVDIRETRVALIENGIIVELHLERAGEARCLGNVVLGRVTRVLPGMQAAFIDVGLEKAAFLHVEDLIRPDDLDAYLSGKKRNDRGDDEETIPDQPAPDAPALPPRTIDVPAAAPSVEVPVAAASVDVPTPAASVEIDVPDAAPSVDVPAPAESIEIPLATDSIEIPDAAISVEVTEDDVPDDIASGEIPASTPSGEAIEGDDDEGDVDDLSTPGTGDEAVAADGTTPATSATQQGRRRRRRRGGRNRKDDAAATPAAPAPREERKAAPPPAAKHKNKHYDHGRIHKDTPIREVVREGQEVLVQISKEPIGTKGARVTSHVSLPGRYVVYLPTVDYIGVSKRIGSDKERQRLRETIEGMKPPSGGLIIRTLAEGLTKKQLKADVGYLVRLWGEIAKKHEGARAPAVLYEELDLVLRVTRDMFGDEIDKVVIDDKTQYDRLVRFVEMFMPERVKDIELYAGDEPLFDAYGIEEEIQRALSRKVPLPSGGYLIIDEAEALTAIDVNTGRFVGKGSKDHEETILKTNLEAVEEIAYQLRFRNLGGLIVLDLIDMDRAASREQVRRRLEDLLQKDKAKSSVNRISDLGLIEMTRKRTRESLGASLHEPCSYCDGTGQVSAKQTIVYEILRAIRREKSTMPGYTVVVHAHPDVINLMKGQEKEAVREAEKRYQRRIDLSPRKEYHLEQYELVGR